MKRPIIFEYLELACYGSTPESIARIYGRRPESIRRALRVAARMGFWKYHIAAHTDIAVYRRDLLERMARLGLLGREAV